MPFGSEHYVPILKGKKGELDALSSLDGTTAARMTPLIEVPPVPWDHDADEPARDAATHISASIKPIATGWIHPGRVFVDVISGDGLADPPATHPVTHLIDQIRQHNVDAVITVGPHHDHYYRDAAAHLANTHRTGVCLRLAGEDLLDPAGVQRLIDDYLAALALQPPEIDLVIDLGGLNAPAPQMALVASAQLTALPHLARWRSLTVAFSAFPQPLSGTVPTRTTTLVSREDAKAWRKIAAAGMARVPTFGDYGADGPEYVDIDPRLLKMVAHIRYTTDDDWLIARGERLTGPGSPGYAQFHALAATVAGRAEYRGAHFSQGDQIIDDCASHTTGPGNQTTWRTVATSHHLTHVTDALATTGVP